MNKNSNPSRIAGILIVIGMIVGILSVIPAVESLDYLKEVSLNQNQVFIGAFFQSIMIPIYIGFALILYPILEQYNKSLAIGFVGFRIMAGMFHLIGILLLPLFLLLSQKFVNDISPDLLYFQTLGEVLKLGRDLVNHVGMILSLSLSNLILYYIFYKTKLIPQWLTIWGILGYILTIMASYLLLFNFINVITSTYMILMLPVALQEMILAIWLITKGFNSKAIK